MTKPWIGIPTRFHDDGPMAEGIRRYVDAVIWAGGLPVMIPTFASPAVTHEYMDRLDGVLLPGSPHDLDPARWGEPPHRRLGKLLPEREALDMALLDHAEKTDLPVFGICFGAQSLNVFRGGTLVQDIASTVPAPVFHDDHGEPPQPARHVIRLTPRSLLGRLAGQEVIEVNSFHHQSAGRLGQNLRAVATAPDGVVEAIEDLAGKFVLGVQWHPERGFQDDALSRALFAEFIRAAGKSTSSGHPV